MLKYISIPAGAILDENVTPQQFRTLAVIAFYGSMADHEAYPSYNTLCRDIGISRRLLIRYMNHLCKLGYVEKKPRLRPNGSRSTNTYHVPLNININPDLGDEVEKYCEKNGGGFGSFHHQRTAIAAQKEGGVVAPSTTTPSGAQHHPPSGAQHHPHKNTSLNKREKNINTKSPKLSLEEWEAKIGAKLCVEMMAVWMKDNRVDPARARPCVEAFRDKVLAGGKVYADFTAAFKVWLRNGWLNVHLSQLQFAPDSTQPEAEPSAEVVYHRGVLS